MDPLQRRLMKTKTRFTARSISFTMGLMGITLLSACDVSQMQSDLTGSSPAGAASVSIPPAISAIFESECKNRPTPSASSGLVLSEQDDANVLSGASKLMASNVSGTLYVEPSTDGKVTWAARKWAIASTKAKADDNVKNVKVNSSVTGGEADLVVSQPNVNTNNEQYQVCIVVQAPADWIQKLTNSSGDLHSVSHVGTLTADTSSGDLIIDSHGAGAITAQVSSGTLSVETASNNPVNLDASSGVVNLIQTGSGNVTAQSASGAVNVTADSRVGVQLTTSSGAVDYTLLDGGIPLKTASTIDVSTGVVTLELSSKVGLQLDAQVDVGTIAAPASFGNPQTFDTTGQKLASTVSPGGATLTVRSSTGTINISQK